MVHLRQYVLNFLVVLKKQLVLKVSWLFDCISIGFLEKTNNKND